MTHILIPIADIEAKIKQLRPQPIEASQAIANSLENMLKTFKQISLDEKDIIEKAQTHTDFYNHRKPEITNAMGESYQQALKDLL